MNPDYMPGNILRDEDESYFEAESYLKNHYLEYLRKHKYLDPEEDGYDSWHAGKLSARAQAEYYSRYIEEGCADQYQHEKPRGIKPDVGHLISWVTGQSHESPGVATGLVIDKLGVEVYVLRSDGEKEWVRRSFVAVIS